MGLVISVAERVEAIDLPTIEGPFGEHESLPSRNTTRGFTGRTRKNLEPARASHCEREDFHVVTQLVNSFLGIVMLPSTRDHKHKALLITLNDLGKKDWPKWDIEEKDPEKTETLQRLLEKLRNAAGHGRFEFRGDLESRNLRDVWVTVSDDPIGNSPWSAEINGEDLYTFCVLLSKYTEKHFPAARSQGPV